MDLIEQEYDRAIRLALYYEDNDHAADLAQGLKEYQNYYKEQYV